MNVNEKLIRPLSEAKYLTEINAERYRVIMRIFYLEYEKLHYWLYQEDIYHAMHADPYFADYRIDQCASDLNQLVNWKNLNTIQDTRKVSTIEEFKNKKFRYQLSPVSVEIERLMISLENLSLEGSSLEPGLLERIRINLQRVSQLPNESDEQVYGWWNDLNNDFVRLIENCQDYMADLSSVKAEEMMRTQQFLLFKDKLLNYLRNFISSLQKNGELIRYMFLSIEPSQLDRLIQRLVDYEMNIPRLSETRDPNTVRENLYDRFNSIQTWFGKENYLESEAFRLLETTNEIIRRITRYALQMSEQSGFAMNRREEYRKVAQLFLLCDDLAMAHCMSAMVFGIEKPLHYSFIRPRLSDNLNQSIFDEAAADIEIKPRVRSYRERSNRTAISDTAKQREAIKAELKAQMEKDQAQLEQLEHDGRIDFSTLPPVTPQIRATLLKWLSDALENESRSSKTVFGRAFYVDLTHSHEKCVVRSSDGNMVMPCFTIVFESAEHSL